jgi:hypothetical protein
LKIDDVVEAGRIPAVEAGHNPVVEAEHSPVVVAGHIPVVEQILVEGDNLVAGRLCCIKQNKQRLTIVQNRKYKYNVTSLL